MEHRPLKKRGSLVESRAFFCTLLSFFCVAFGQPAFSEAASICAAAFGYAVFWVGARSIQPNRLRFFVSVGWFTAVQAVQLHWLASTVYMGPFILVVYLLLCLGVGAQFGVLSLYVFKKAPSWTAACGLAGMWALFEWSRLFVLTGFPWNPAGMALAAHGHSIQWAALCGIYGLSFWVILVNILGFHGWTTRKWGRWALCASLPYLFGALHQGFWEQILPEGKECSVALVQTAFKQEEKERMARKVDLFIPPAQQWAQALACLVEQEETRFDYIVFPETAFQGRATSFFCPLEEATAIWEKSFGSGTARDFPPLRPPFTKQARDGEIWVNHLFWAKALANRYQAEVISGFESKMGGSCYNAALHFQPHTSLVQSYEKRLLVPIGEYIPLAAWKFFSSFIADQFGIEASLKKGSGAKILQGALPIGMSICSEEAYGFLLREMRLAGAELFVNVTNDGWFPNTRLPQHHFTQGRVRAVENGVCALRACNQGKSCAINCFGEEIPLSLQTERKIEIFPVSLKIRSYPTLYTLVGDGLILGIASCFVFFLFLPPKKTLP